jgi:hypothetical protein
MEAVVPLEGSGKRTKPEELLVVLRNAPRGISVCLREELNRAFLARLTGPLERRARPLRLLRVSRLPGRESLETTRTRPWPPPADV